MQNFAAGIPSIRPRLYHLDSKSVTEGISVLSGIEASSSHPFAPPSRTFYGMPFKRPTSAISFAATLALWFCGLSVILCLLISQVIDLLASRSLSRQSGEKLAELAYQITDRLDQGLYERYREVELMSKRSELGDPSLSPAAKQALLDTLQTSYPQYAWIGMTDTAGKVLAATRGMLRGEDVSQRPWFTGASRGVFVGDVHDAKLLAKKMPHSDGARIRFIDIAFPYRHPDASVAGILGVHLSWNWTKDIERSVIAPAQQRSHVEAMIVGRDGCVLLGPPSLQGKKIDIAALLGSNADSGYFRVPRWSMGKDYLVGVSKTKGFRSYPGLGWSVLVRQTSGEAFAPATHLRKAVLGVGLGFSLVFSLFGVYNARRITRSIRALADSAHKVLIGQADTIAVSKNSYAEVEQLGRTLNSLLDSLDRSQQMLKDANASLETRVAERTSQLARSETRLRTIADNMPVMIAYVDKDQRYHFCNNIYEAWFGKPVDKIIGKTVAEVLGESYAAVRPYIRKALSGENVSFELSRPYQGQLQYLRINYIADMAGGAIAGIYILTQDLTDTVKRQLVLEHEVAHDSLTGLANRFGAMNHIRGAMARARRSGIPMALMFLDLNKFKEINDTLGHDAGDQALIGFSRRLKSCVRETDIVARLAGDEFVIIAERLVNGVQDAHLIASKILASLQSPIICGGVGRLISTSIGIAMFRDEQESETALLRRADEAMYEAKRHGANAVMVAAPPPLPVLAASA